MHERPELLLWVSSCIAILRWLIDPQGDCSLWYQFWKKWEKSPCNPRVSHVVDSTFFQPSTTHVNPGNKKRGLLWTNKWSQDVLCLTGFTLAATVMPWCSSNSWAWREMDFSTNKMLGWCETMRLTCFFKNSRSWNTVQYNNTLMHSK